MSLGQEALFLRACIRIIVASQAFSLFANQDSSGTVATNDITPTENTINEQTQEPSLTQPLFSPYSANYDATWDAGWFPISIDAKRQLMETENGWKVSFEAYSSVADVSEASNFVIENRTIKPQSYHFKTTGFLTKSKRNMEARWDEGKVYLPYKKKYADFDMPSDLQDSISYQEQIRMELMQGKTEFSYPISYKDRIKKLEFKVIKNEALKSKAGPIDTILVEQSNTRHRKEFTRIWFAKEHEFLLVKLYMSDKHGDTTLIELENATLGERKIKGF